MPAQIQPVRPAPVPPPPRTGPTTPGQVPFSFSEMMGRVARPPEPQNQETEDPIDDMRPDWHAISASHANKLSSLYTPIHVQHGDLSQVYQRAQQFNDDMKFCSSPYGVMFSYSSNRFVPYAFDPLREVEEKEDYKPDERAKKAKLRQLMGKNSC